MAGLANVPAKPRAVHKMIKPRATAEPRVTRHERNAAIAMPARFAS
jgi:hypothetical protein